MIQRTPALLLPLLIMICSVASAQTGSGSAIVEVTTEPEIYGVTLTFDGIPSGVLLLEQNQPNTLVSDGLSNGEYASAIVEATPILAEQGYRLVNISCNDGASPVVSRGVVDTGTANFSIEDEESVTCQYTFAIAPEETCLCPKSGSWTATNHPGAMVCQGAPISVPFPGSTTTGTIEMSDQCRTLFGTDFAADTADMTMFRTEGCGFEGVVGAAEGSPMDLVFTMNVESEEHLTGNIFSQVTQQGVTCTTTRTFDLHFDE